MSIEKTVFLKKLSQSYGTYAKSGVEVEYAVFAVKFSPLDIGDFRTISSNKICEIGGARFFFSNIKLDDHYVLQSDRTGVLGVEHEKDKARMRLYDFAKKQAKDIADQRKWDLVELLDKPGPLVLDPATNLPIEDHGPFGEHPNIKRGPHPGPKIKY